MARPMWTGTLSFGLVNVSVGLVPATVNRNPTFHQFQRGTTDRIRYVRVNERTGEEVPYRDIVKGAEVAEGQYVLLEDEELDAVAPGRSHLLELKEFVDGDEIEPIHYAKAYYLVPSTSSAATAYALLCAALSRTGRVGICTFVMNGRQELGAVRSQNGALTLETMRYADEIRDPAEVFEELPDAGDFTEREISTAARLVETMTVPWRPEEHVDEHRVRIEELIEAKRTGRETITHEAPPSDTRTADLMDALRASLEGRDAHGDDGRKAG
ncbi:Ku protein [Marinactinospora thermotolerans]|uniref:Non-homologous end joining protein Ku n=1 Tax=Marinactinospora thermotolerans DSM 45154 TaxID=1122192 RepID=A0A1T4LZF2_9ACTN|nr:Ku protein [Marinactinospora thermotolerans]SJZ60031.1 DNA end-binding protein Ku [Marinactinospora thermotolerans DSM 45154]